MPCTMSGYLSTMKRTPWWMSILNSFTHHVCWGVATISCLGRGGIQRGTVVFGHLGSMGFYKSFLKDGAGFALISTGGYDSA